MLIRDQFINMIINKETLILASSSKSRFNILKNCGLRFNQVNPKCDEEELKKKINKSLKKPNNIVKILSYEKAKSISETKRFFNDFVIGCDTLVYLNRNIFDKAKSLKEAKKKIQTLSGKTHKIVSGITVCNKGKKIWQDTETSSVKIRKLKSLQINNYLNKTGKQILSSVGCYQIEALGPIIIEDIKGDYFNIMGLPLFKLLRFLHKPK